MKIKQENNKKNRHLFSLCSELEQLQKDSKIHRKNRQIRIHELSLPVQLLRKGKIKYTFKERTFQVYMKTTNQRMKENPRNQRAKQF